MKFENLGLDTLYFESQLLGTLYVRRSADHDAARPDSRAPRWLEAFRLPDGGYVLHLGAIELFFNKPEARPSHSLS